MTISMGSMGATLGKMMVENAIENKETNDKIADAAHLAEEGQIHIQGANTKQANNLKSAMSYVSMAQSAVSVGRAGMKAGQEIDTAAQRIDAQPQFEANVDAARANPTEMSDTSDTTETANLKNLRLGRDGPTVGDRFPPAQMSVLTHEDSIQNMRAQVQTEHSDFSQDQVDAAVVQELTSDEIGFSQAEAQTLVREGRDGLDTEEAVDFMWTHRKTEGEQQKEQTREKIFDAIIGQTAQMLNQGLGAGMQRAGKQGNRAGDAQGGLDAIADEATEQGRAHQQAIDDILTEGLTQGQEHRQNQG